MVKVLVQKPKIFQFLLVGELGPLHDPPKKVFSLVVFVNRVNYPELRRDNLHGRQTGSKNSRGPYSKPKEVARDRQPGLA
jgi:hypothetical protein